MSLPSVKLYMASIFVDGEEIDNKNHATIAKYDRQSPSAICLHAAAPFYCHRLTG
eukprot:COSAG02_NODE_3517_length_6624_cov_16.921533_9_plen_55_part_00